MLAKEIQVGLLSVMMVAKLLLLVLSVGEMDALYQTTQEFTLEQLQSWNGSKLKW